MEADGRCADLEIRFRDLTNTIIPFENEIATMHPNLFGDPIQPDFTRVVSAELRIPRI